MGYALVFSGQGLQHAGMLPWLERDATVIEVERLLGSHWRDRLADPDWAGNNRHAQVLLTGLAIAAWRQLVSHLPPPAVIAGYSVGELAAFSAAGVFDAANALTVAAARAEAMDKAAAVQAATGLLGVSGTTPEALARWCERFGLQLAIRIGPGSAVVGGLQPALHSAAEAASAQGMRCTALNIAMASHTHWMQPATEEFGRVLSGVVMCRPSHLLLSGAIGRGRVRSGEEAREALAIQISRTVRWDDCMDAIAAQRVDAVLEVGPGQALARMWMERCPEVPVRSADEFRSAPAIVKWLLTCA